MVHRKNSIDLEYVISGMEFDVAFPDDDMFTDEEKKDIVEFIEKMSENIYIDKSYVECYENQRKNTFMIESGWNALQDVILDSKYCKYLDSAGVYTVIDAFATMGRCYLYECLALKTEKFQDVAISFRKGCVFEVTICKDVSHDSRRYVGKWQDWTFDENGNPVNEGK